MNTSSKRKTLGAFAVGSLGLVLSGVVLAASNGTMANLIDKRPIIDQTSIEFGAYDPHGDFSSDTNVKIEHLFLPWQDVDLTSLAQADSYARQRGRSLLITVEPWSWSGERNETSDVLLKGILAGNYNANMGAICAAASNLKSPVTIRWAQEMDEPDGQFTWGNWAPGDYIAAYRMMVTECRKHISTAKFMWSPKGNPALTAFYPGDDVVDIVGLSVFGLQQFDKDKFGGERTFSEALEPGYGLAAKFGKPVVVAELGYEGDNGYVSSWAKDAAKPHPEFPSLTAVVYFNDREVYPWPDNYGLPNWRVVEQAIN